MDIEDKQLKVGPTLKFLFLKTLHNHLSIKKTNKAVYKDVSKI